MKIKEINQTLQCWTNIEIYVYYVFVPFYTLLYKTNTVFHIGDNYNFKREYICICIVGIVNQILSITLICHLI